MHQGAHLGVDTSLQRVAGPDRDSRRRIVTDLPPVSSDGSEESPSCIHAEIAQSPTPEVDHGWGEGELLVPSEDR
jgi:hypothetical protein